MSKSYRELAKQADEVTKVLRSKLKPNGIDGKSDTMLDQVAELKLNQANIEREARIDTTELLLDLWNQLDNKEKLQFDMVMQGQIWALKNPIKDDITELEKE